MTALSLHIGSIDPMRLNFDKVHVHLLLPTVLLTKAKVDFLTQQHTIATQYIYVYTISMYMTIRKSIYGKVLS